MTPFVALVMPVHGRFGLTRLVMEQRRRLVYDLAGLGVDADVVVVGDDENLGAAAERGFHTVQSPNPLGRRINDGFEYAFRELDATHAIFNGSDSWLLPGVVADLPAQGRVRASEYLALCSSKALVVIPAPPPLGRPPWTVSRAVVEPCGFRPVDDARKRGLDGTLRNAIREFDPDAFYCPAGGDDPLRVVDFRRGPWDEQMTPWELFVQKRVRHLPPWETLATRYPVDLVERMERFYAEGA